MPRITISINAPNNTSHPDLLTLDLPPDFTIANLKGSVQSETSLPASSQHFYLNGEPLRDDNKTLEGLGVKDGEMLAMIVGDSGLGEPRQAQQQQRSAGARARAPHADEIETTRLRILGNPHALASVWEQKPELAATLDDRWRFQEMWWKLYSEEEDRQRERQNQIALVNEDPFNVETQRKIEEMIRQDRVMENLQHAYEHNPEFFGRVTMLYINAEVNGHPVKAFVDSGAQATIMSPACAEACGIMRLIDKRYSGIAKGVGTAKILGRVHEAEIKIGNAILPCAFTVMEGKDVDLLLGLDMLKRYQACIDLNKNKLVFQGNEVSFLPESEIPKYLEEAELNEPTLSGPGGTEIGGKSGAVRPAGASATAAESSGSSAGNFRGQGQTLGGSSTAPQQQGRSDPSSAGSGSAPSFPQASIDQLQSLGFSREEAIAALNATGGNVEYAAGLLFQR